jgi:predicted acylesterase/phospholipase RssA
MCIDHKWIRRKLKLYLIYCVDRIEGEINIVGIKEIINNIRLKLDQDNQKRTYRNLVFKGGGVRGIAYMGAVEVLEELNVLGNIERVAGTSSGAIAATLACFRKDSTETMDLFNTLDLQKVPQRAVNGNSRNIILLTNPNTQMGAAGIGMGSTGKHWDFSFSLTNCTILIMWMNQIICGNF